MADILSISHSERPLEAFDCARNRWATLNRLLKRRRVLIRKISPLDATYPEFPSGRMPVIHALQGEFCTDIRGPLEKRAPDIGDNSQPSIRSFEQDFLSARNQRRPQGGWRAACKEIEAFQQTRLSSVVLSHDQIDGAQITDREVIEAAKPGDLDSSEHRQAL